MKITVTAPGGLLHGRERFEEGREYDVETTLAGYFLGNGWATSESRSAKPLLVDQDVALDIQNGNHSSRSPKVGTDG